MSNIEMLSNIENPPNHEFSGVLTQASSPRNIDDFVKPEDYLQGCIGCLPGVLFAAWLIDRLAKKHGLK